MDYIKQERLSELAMTPTETYLMVLNYDFSMDFKQEEARKIVKIYNYNLYFTLIVFLYHFCTIHSYNSVISL